MDKQYILDYCRKTPENLNVNVLSTLIDAYLQDNTGEYEEEDVSVTYGSITTAKKTGTITLTDDVDDLIELMKAGKTLVFSSSVSNTPTLYSVTFIEGETPTIYAASKFNNDGAYGVIMDEGSYYSRMDD